MLNVQQRYLNTKKVVNIGHTLLLRNTYYHTSTYITMFISVGVGVFLSGAQNLIGEYYANYETHHNNNQNHRRQPD